MNDDLTIRTLSDSIKQRKTKKYGPGDAIRLIVSESSDLSKLENLMKNDTFFRVFKTHAEIKMGFIVYGSIGVSTWDSEKKTYYPPEAETVMYRELIAGRPAVERFAELFEGLEFRNHILNYRNL